MQFIPRPGVALWVPTPIDNKPYLHHLHFLLTGASGNRDSESEVVVVSVTSADPNRKMDDACLLGADDHPNIHHPSFIYYRLSRKLNVGHIQTCLNRKVFLQFDTLEQHVLERVIDGAHKSSHTPNWVKKKLSGF